MRKIYSLSAFIFISFIANAQIVNIPDASLKARLLMYEPVIDTNHDNEIQVSEAQAVTELSLNNFPSFIEEVTGIEAFTNLTTLNMNYVGIAGFNPSVFTHLQNLYCSDLSFSGSLDLSSLTSLRNINVGNCHLTGLNVSGLVNLQALICGYNHIPSLNLSGMTSLVTLNCEANNLTTLNLTGLSSLQTVDCSYNTYLTSLVTTGANNVTTLNCSMCALTSFTVTNMTHLTSLDCHDQGLTSLDLTGLTSLTQLNCYSNNLSTLAVGHLTNLTWLSCSSNHIASLDVAPLVNLTRLDCSYNQLATLNVAPLVNLTGLSCQGNLLSTLDLHALTHLTWLYFGYNNFSAINLSNNTELIELYCSNNQLANLSISNLTQLQHLVATSNQLTTLDVTNLHGLQEIRVGGNLFTSLDFSQNHAIGAMGIFVDDCPNLTYVNAKTGAYGIMNQVYGFGMSNCPNLQAVCVNDDDIPYMTQMVTAGQFGTTPTTVQINSYCTFAPGGVYNTIAGTVTFDLNHNGCDVGDYHPKDFKVNINDGTNSGATFTSAAGSYSFYTQAGSIALTPQFESPYFTITPATSTLTFANLDGSAQTQNYCVTANGIYNDATITLFQSQNARPGFDANYVLVYKNKGTEALNGSITLSFDDSVLDFVSATPAIDSQSANTLTWNYTNLQPFESRTINFKMNVNSPVETPAVNIGDLLHYTATINPISGDETPDDNIAHLNQVVNGSLDPNDKTCLEGSNITPQMVGGYLNYVIQFQNTGTYYAENVVVKDMIDTAKFDISSLQLVASSHPNVTRVTGNKVEFIFENINLPAVIDNEPGSHGFVAFKIKTKNNLVLGNQIQNTADIYFDFNAPVTTNTTSTTVALLNINGPEANSVSVTPIPVKDVLQISALDTITAVELFDIQGRLLQAKTNDSLTATLDFTGKTKGVYLVKVYTEKGMKTQKIIKE